MPRARMTPEERDTLHEKTDVLRKAYGDVKNALDALPPSRMKSLAFTDLESSFTRAVFAVAEMHNPIEDG